MLVWDVMGGSDKLDLSCFKGIINSTINFKAINNKLLVFFTMRLNGANKKSSQRTKLNCLF